MKTVHARLAAPLQSRSRARARAGCPQTSPTPDPVLPWNTPSTRASILIGTCREPQSLCPVLRQG